MRKTSVRWFGTWVLWATAASAAGPGPLARAVQPFVDQGQYAGAVMIVVSVDKVLDAETVGFADVERGEPMRPDTFGYIASTGKPIIATAVMMLVDEGKVALDDPVSKYLPDFAPRIAAQGAGGNGELSAPAQPVTVRMLLNNTHGLMPDLLPTARPYDSMPLAEHVRDLTSHPLAHEPGAAFVYSGVGINVAARVVEVVSGEDIEKFLRRKLLTPLGMKDSTFFPSNAQLTRLATSYWMPPGTTKLTATPLSMLTQPLGDRKARFAPAGGLFSTAPDMARFGQLFLGRGFYRGHRYLSEASVDAMTHRSLGDEAQKGVPQIPGVDIVLSYGLGWGVAANGAYFHPGLGGADIGIDATRRFAVVLLAQSGTQSSFAVRSVVMKTAEKLYLTPARF
ncbi:MAG TPA: serine hydrolase domain-containing protein [Steroidobacteraceae bacterium]|nr:serine hydrolase domain-containing protein [Steroidobacteraceae bacterium]